MDLLLQPVFEKPAESAQKFNHAMAATVPVQAVGRANFRLETVR
jgi:hypothetical protein